MSNILRAQPGRHRRPWTARIFGAIAAALSAFALTFASYSVSLAHEGHDHDKPAPLNLPIAPRVIAVTPDYELVGVVSGNDRLTIFLRRFETGEPLQNAKLGVSLGDMRVEATRMEDAVFEAQAPWLNAREPIDLIFHLTLPDDQDILTGTLESRPAAAIGAKPPTLGQGREIVIALVAMTLGALLALFAMGQRRARRAPEDKVAPQLHPLRSEPTDTVSQLKRRVSTLAGACAILAFGLGGDARAAEGSVALPSVPASMATDAPQRMPDASLFVPAATQHLLAIRTMRAQETRAPKTVQLVGTVIPDPNSFGRVQSGHAGKIVGAEGGLPFVGMKVKQGQVLAYLQHQLEAYNKGNLQAEIAELEARIALQEAKLARYLAAPLAIPPIRIDETKGEIQALRNRRRQLTPTLAEKEAIQAPITGIVSVANVVAGQSIDARELLFEIVDPGRLWIEAIGHKPGLAANLKRAVAITNAGQELTLEFAGVGLSLKQQAAPLSFRITDTVEGLSVGLPVTVMLQSELEVTGIVLPSSSIVRLGSGLSAVWVKRDPERFEPYTVRFEALDGQRVVILAGLKPDMRVVTSGATLLNQIR
jgi:cobalt-zinc-cadmium efflux system membrane fusion protein